MLIKQLIKLELFESCVGRVPQKRIINLCRRQGVRYYRGRPVIFELSQSFCRAVRHRFSKLPVATEPVSAAEAEDRYQWVLILTYNDGTRVRVQGGTQEPSWFRDVRQVVDEEAWVQGKWWTGYCDGVSCFSPR